METTSNTTAPAFDRRARIYRGYRNPAGTGFVAVVEGQAPERPLTHRIRHSPTGLEWGYGGSGPADLARSILFDYFGRDVSASVYQRFKAIHVATLPSDAFALPGYVVESFVQRFKSEAGLQCIHCGDAAMIDCRPCDACDAGDKISSDLHRIGGPDGVR